MSENRGRIDSFLLTFGIVIEIGKMNIRLRVSTTNFRFTFAQHCRLKEKKKKRTDRTHCHANQSDDLSQCGAALTFNADRRIVISHGG